MSAPEPRVQEVRFEIVQVAAWRGGAAALAAPLRASGWELPTFGHAWTAPGRLVCAVRPDRWLLMADRGSGTPVGALYGACSATVGADGAVTDLTAARRSWRIIDPQARVWLAAGCRLDLDPVAFPTGRATVTLIAQVPVMLVGLADAWLAVAPSSMGGHFEAWLQHAAHTASQDR